VHYAADRDHLECIQYLLKDEESVDVRNKKGQTPLMKALGNEQYEQRDVVEWLLAKNADVSAEDGIGRNIFHYVVSHYIEDLHLVKMLVNKGVEINRQDKRGWSALFYASRGGNESIVSYLLEKSANPDLTDNKGNTCLHLACPGYDHDDDLKCVKLLVDRMKISVNCKNLKEETPLLLAASRDDVRTVALLLERGADPNIQDKKGSTCLQWAARSGRLGMAKLLLHNRADVNAEDNSGYTPLAFAEYNGHEDVADYLRYKMHKPCRKSPKREARWASRCSWLDEYE
jgi:uncharacterized protein